MACVGGAVDERESLPEATAQIAKRRLKKVESLRARIHYVHDSHHYYLLLFPIL